MPGACSPRISQVNSISLARWPPASPGPPDWGASGLSPVQESSAPLRREQLSRRVRALCVEPRMSNSTQQFAAVRVGPLKTDGWAWGTTWSSVNEEQEIGSFDHGINHLEVQGAVLPGKGDLGLDRAGSETASSRPSSIFSESGFPYG